jgi:uncharacterized protein
MLAGANTNQFESRGSAARSQPIDAVRGFALLGIIVVNAQFFASPISALPVPETASDALAFWIVSAFAMGKFFLIYSFLFGFGFAAILTKSEIVGKPVKGRFLRRLLALFAFGILHATFLFFGDILMLYAILGLALWMCRNWPTRRLVSAAALTYVVAIACQVGISQYMNEDILGASVEPGKGYLGGFLEGARQRVADWPIALPFVVIFNGPAALAMFLLGLAAGRSKLVPPAPDMMERLVPLAKFTLPSAMVATGIAAVLMMPGSASLALPQVIISAAILDAVFAPVLSFGLVVLVLNWAMKAGDNAVVRWLSVAGGSSLSGYIFHSVILSVVFNGWGMGFYGSLEPASVFAISVMTFVSIVALLNIWKQWFRYGPDEWLLRSFVDLEWKQIRI